MQEIVYLCRFELTKRLTDLLFRRTDIALTGRLSREVILETGDIGATVFGWDSARLGEEIRLAEDTASAHGLHLPKEPLKAIG